MARCRRLKVRGEVAYYHIMSRTVGQQFLLGDREKEVMTGILDYYSEMYFVEKLAFSIMSNHFHLVIKSEPEHLFDDREVTRRYVRFILKEKNPKRASAQKQEISASDIAAARKKLENISEFTRSIKQTFSCWYNKTHNRTGYLWGDRFKSVLLEPGESVLRCCAYVELNPVRAGIVTNPESYRWCSLHRREFGSKKDRSLSYDGMFDDTEARSATEAELHRAYRRVVYYCGNIKRTTLRDLEEGRTTDDARSPISDELYEQELKRDFQLPRGTRFLGRIRHFSDGAVIGSKDFLLKAYATFGDTVIHKKDRNVYPTCIGDRLFSIRKLQT